MPFCDISDDVSLHYITNSPRGDASDLDPNKTTVILLPPVFTSVEWLREQFAYGRLSDNHNLIGIECRNMGQTRAPLSHKRDVWVDAADLAVAHEKLSLPPCHIFSAVMPACVVALGFAALFPAKCLSLCLCTFAPQPGDDPDWVLRGYIELLDTWCFPADLETYERGCLELSKFMFDGLFDRQQVNTELEDEMVAWWQMNLNPTHRTRYLAQSLVPLNRPRFSDKQLRSIQTPALFIQGDKTPADPVENAREVCGQMPNSKFLVIKGGPRFITVAPQYASVVNRVYCQFLAELPPPPVFQPSKPDPVAVCRGGLERLAAFVDKPSVAQRDPRSTLSFSVLSEELLQKNAYLLEKYIKGEKDALSPLGADGQPIRKFSERHRDEWTPAAFERMKQPIFAGAQVVVVESSTDEGEQPPC